MMKSTWKKRIKVKENNSEENENLKKSLLGSDKNNKAQGDSKNAKDKLNLKPVYIKPSKDILDIIPFCNNIYTIDKN